ncbi:class I SAM-dependent methyltransferase [Pseudochelatococcus sp. B33]
MRERFTQIYATDEWHGGSGEGSFPIHTRGYVRFLEQFIRNNNIRSILDFGCGDWQFSRSVNWQGARYTGVDIVPSVIEKNKAAFQRDGIAFALYSGDPAELPEADLLIAKDVLQHWSNNAIAKFLPVIERYRFALLTNCTNPAGETVNVDIEDGAFRYLDLREAPFGLKAKHVYTFTNAEKKWWNPFTPARWRKKVLLHAGH